MAAALPGSTGNMLQTRLHFDTRSRMVKEQAVKVATPPKKLKLYKERRVA